jgi:Bacterial Ig domain
MKKLITLLVVLMPLAVSSVHACDNPCWLNHIGPQGTTNQEKVTWIAMHGVEAYNRVKDHFGWRKNRQDWEKFRLLIDHQGERGFALGVDEIFIKTAFGFKDCKTPPPTPTPTPKPTATPCAPVFPQPQRVSVCGGKFLHITLTHTTGAIAAWVLGTHPLHGILTGTPPFLTYTPKAGYLGPDSFTFAVRDKCGHVSFYRTIWTVLFGVTSASSVAATTLEVTIVTKAATSMTVSREDFWIRIIIVFICAIFLWLFFFWFGFF